MNHIEYLFEIWDSFYIHIEIFGDKEYILRTIENQNYQDTIVKMICRSRKLHKLKRDMWGKKYEI